MPRESDTPKCRECGKSVRLRLDETAGQHKTRTPAGLEYQCPGTGHPPAGDPPCLPTCVAVGFLGWPTVGQLKAGTVHASTHVCDSPSHQAEASAWVRGITGHDGVFEPFAKTRQEPATTGGVLF